MSGPFNKHVISVLLDNEAGVLSRVAGLFSARGYNIESLTVAETDDPTLSRMTIVTFGADNLAEQIEKQLNKLVDVVKVTDLSKHEHIEREMLLVKVECPGGADGRARLDRFAHHHHAVIVEHTGGLSVLELAAPAYAVDAFVKALKESGWDLREIARSGVISLGRGTLTLGI